MLDRLVTFAAVFVALSSFARMVSERNGNLHVCAACTGDVRVTEQPTGHTPPPTPPSVRDHQPGLSAAQAVGPLGGAVPCMR